MPERGILASLADQLADLWQKRTPLPPEPEATLDAPVVQRSLAAGPFADQIEASPGRYQSEPFGVHLTAAAPTASIRATARPRFWCCYLKAAATAGDGVWLRSGEQPPSAPALASGLPLAVPHWLSGTSTVIIHAPELTLSMLFVGTGPVDVIAVACTNVPEPHR